MNLQEYQKFTPTTAIYPKDKELEYLVLGLISELIELTQANTKAKKEKEAGDVYWYCSQLCNFFGVYDMEGELPFGIAVPRQGETLAMEIASLTKKVIRLDRSYDAYQEDMLLKIACLICGLRKAFHEPRILELNINKLKARQQNNTLKGDGDDR